MPRLSEKRGSEELTYRKPAKALSEEDRILKTGYAARLFERYPINENGEEDSFSSPESAYLYKIEEKYMNVPDILEFEELKEQIPEVHRARIECVWLKLTEARDAFIDAKEALNQEADLAPRSSDILAIETIQKMKIDIRSRISASVLALISDSNQSPELQKWQLTNKVLRVFYYSCSKNYLQSLRIYYELLLEKPEANVITDKPLVIDAKNPIRQNIAIHNRYARLIDATHQSISLAKAAHHQQSKKRIRKTKAEPYWFHPLQVLLNHLADTAPFIVEKEKLEYDLIIQTIVLAVHDLPEDTHLTVEDVIHFLTVKMDQYDSSIDQQITSGFGKDRLELKNKVLNLVGSHSKATIRAVLRVMCNNTKLSNQEIKTALTADSNNKIITSRDKIAESIGIEDVEKTCKTLGIKPLEGETISKTYETFPETGPTALDKKMDKKMTTYLVRLNSLVSSARRQYALIAKLEDRAHNLSELDGSPVEFQLSTLRSTIARLIAWCMLDYDKDKFPLYNALPRLIDTAFTQYEKLVTNHREALQPIDLEIFARLSTWKFNVKRYE